MRGFVSLSTAVDSKRKTLFVPDGPRVRQNERADFIGSCHVLLLLIEIKNGRSFVIARYTA